MVILAILVSFAIASVLGATRTRDGLLALYDFRSSDSATVKDRSGAGEPLDLKIGNPEAVRRSEGSLEVRSNTVLRSEKVASKITDAVRQSGEITIEAWIRPAGTGQGGPARIVTLSKDPNERNFTLGHDGDRFDVRFRTTQTSGNGIPSLSSAGQSLSAELTHVVYTRDRGGLAQIFINGKKSVEQTVGGDTSNWDGSFRLALANELTGDRPWLGTFHLVAIYSRALSPKEVEQNFNARTGPPTPPAPVAVAEKKAAPELKTTPTRTEAARQFDTQIAPLIGRHCVECHGQTKQKGRLDLSRRETAFAGGKSGKVIVPGNAMESLLWKKVESDEMPDERPPLSSEEKKQLRQWIDGGAIWSTSATVPTAHVADRRTANTWLRRLTVLEYIETVRSAVGVDIEKEAHRLLPPDLRADGFHNTAYNLNVDLGHVEAYARLATIIVGRMDVKAFAADYTKCQCDVEPPPHPVSGHPLPHRGRGQGEGATGNRGGRNCLLSEKCLRELIAGMGKWLLRRPLDEHEISAFLKVSSAVAKEGGGFSDAARYILEAMLQSPRFIYRIESESTDGRPRRLGPYEMASRLSYTLWGAPPDKELMRAADAGELGNRRRVEAQVQRMLQDPRAVERSTRFLYEWLDLDRLHNLRPNPKTFPKWDGRLAADMRDETLAFFKHVAWEQKRPLSDLLNARVTFASPRLADFYGFPSSHEIAGAGNPKGSSILERSGDGLLALYTFEEGSGDIIRDISGTGEPIHLKIEDPSAVQWEKGRLAVKGATLIGSIEPPKRLIDAVKKSNAVTLEAWITPGDTGQKGPARILTLSSGTGERNFTLGQDVAKFDVRFRSTGTDSNGQPSLSSSSGAVETRPTHVVYTRDPSGRVRLYLNGEQNAGNDVGGDLSNWNDGFRLALANETTKDRAWRGTFHLVAIYNRALTPEEVQSRVAGQSRYDLSSVPARGGLLTQGSVLTVGGDDASMVTRGLFILHDFLWDEVGDPPPCVDTTPVPARPGMSRRAIAETRLANPACGGCHAKFETLAFGLEKFDGLGAYHEKDEHGNKLRDDGQILFPDAKKAVSYQSATELMDLLAGSERVRKGITRKVTQFAIGRPLLPEEAPMVDKIHKQAQVSGGTYASLITAIVMSDLVQRTGQEKKR